jgi:hypothetical protein
MCVVRAFDLIASLNRHPSADEILAAKYLKPPEERAARPKTRDEALMQMQALSADTGAMRASRKLPAHLRAMADKALAVQKKLSQAPTRT